MPKLTKAVIDNHAPREKNYFIWDTEIKGFGCQILKGGKCGAPYELDKI